MERNSGPGKALLGRIYIVAALALSCTSLLGEETTRSPSSVRKGAKMNEKTDIILGIGGVGGVYFLASPGQLIIDLQKRDRNIRKRHTEMRAILFGPDRRVIQEVTIPDDGQPPGSGVGPPQRARLSTEVERKGVYGLNITVSQDRYGEDIIWGFRTNCPYYLIETSRGHKDERHQEPIVLLRPDLEGDVCFLPRRGAFGMDITRLPKGVDEVSVYDSKGELIQSLNVDDKGKVSHRFPADAHRDAAPWRLHLPAQQAVINIDGVTRWERGDFNVNLCYWTPNLQSFFPFQEYRWLLTPYSRTVYGRPGEKREISFQVHNNRERKIAVQLELEFPDGAEWPVELSADRVEVAPKKTAKATLAFSVPSEGDERLCHIRATPVETPEFSTYSTLIVKRGIAPATAALDMPIVLTPYRHENEQFGYLPDYPVDNQVYFDLKNRPFVRTARGVATWREGQWRETDFSSATTTHKRASFGMPSTKIAFDRDNDLYVAATVDGAPALLHSTDGGRTFAAYPLELRDRRPSSFDIEQFSGHNVPNDPPPVIRYKRTASDPRLRWRKVNDLELYLPRKNSGGLSWGNPILVSDKCIGLSAHSGIPSSIVSRGSRVHVTWAEATDPKADVPGVPTFVATYDRDAGKLGKPVLIGYGPPPNDVHNSPCITMDSKGYLHVLIGTHGRTFKYSRSLKPNDAYSGWTPAEDVGPGLRQTYVGLVCDKDDVLHLVFRLWHSGSRYFPASYYASLSHTRKPPDGPWETVRTLVVAPFSEYSIYYHRLTIDRTGSLFLSYDYWSTYWFYRLDHWGKRRALLMSSDGGDTWRLAETKDFSNRLD